MKKILTTLAVLGLGSGYVFAGCGVTKDVSGEFTSIDTEKKEIIFTADGKEETMKFTMDTTMPASLLLDPESAKGKKITVSHEHKQVAAVKVAESA